MRGKIWQLGEHRLMCGDATNPEDMAQLMGFDRAHMMFTDPPYGVNLEEKVGADGPRTESHIENDDLRPDQLRAFWTAAFTEARKRVVPGGAYYICTAGASDLYIEMLRSVRDAGWLLKHQIIWVKHQLVIGRCDYHYMHEPIIYGWAPGTHRFMGDRTRTTVWKYDRPTRSELHPTMKPVGLVCEAIRNSSVEGDIVLDPFGGSGTTLIACERLKRKCRMMELDQHYCETIVSRYERNKRK